MPDGQRAEIARAEYDLSNYFKEQGIMGISNMKLGTRLALGFGVVLAMLAVGTFVGVNRLGVMNDNLNDIVNNDNKRIFLANEMVDQVRNIAISVRNILLNQDEGVVVKERERQTGKGAHHLQGGCAKNRRDAGRERKARGSSPRSRRRSAH